MARIAMMNSGAMPNGGASATTMSVKLAISAPTVSRAGTESSPGYQTRSWPSTIGRSPFPVHPMAASRIPSPAGTLHRPPWLPRPRAPPAAPAPRSAPAAPPGHQLGVGRGQLEAAHVQVPFLCHTRNGPVRSGQRGGVDREVADKGGGIQMVADEMLPQLFNHFSVDRGLRIDRQSCPLGHGKKSVKGGLWRDLLTAGGRQ